MISTLSVAVILTVPLNRKTVTTNALIPAVLRRGTNRLDSMKKLEIEMEEMYGASLDCGLDKSGKNHVLKFYIETAKDEMVGEKGVKLSAGQRQRLKRLLYGCRI